MEEKSKKNKKGKLNGRILSISLYVLVIALIALISFVGIYKKDMNTMKNALPKYALEQGI